jgi:nucleotide-binding universal stress UspA family protein
MNIRNVLVPVDFSPPSRLAVDYGVAFTRKFRAKLTLMHVVELPSALSHPFSTESSRIEKEHREQAMRMLSALLASEDQDDLDLQIVIKSGDVKDEITSVIDEQHADIVVMGTHGRGLFGRWLTGSVTQAILRQTSVPILTICRATRPLAFGRILFATDLSQPSRQGFKFAVEMARLMRSVLVVVHVIAPSTLTYGGAEMAPFVNEHNSEETRKSLDDFVAEAKHQEVRVETVLVEGVPAEAISKAADDNTVDLILLTVRGKGFVERAILGTTAERVIREAHLPVISIPVNAAGPDYS